jgi:PhnB protein
MPPRVDNEANKEVQTRIEDVTPEEMERRLTDPAFVAAMDYVSGADFFPPS